MIHLITGNTGAGKTTYALALKKEVKGVIFSIDYWNKTLFLDDKKETDGVDWFLERINRSDEMIQSLIIQLHEAGTPAILDLGFAKAERRARFYAFAKAQQIPFQLHFLDIDKEVRQQRVTHRNLEKGTTYQFDVSPADFEFMETWFEPLTSAERKIAYIKKAMNIEAFREYCMSKKGVTEAFPFDADTLVFKVMGKMFAVCGLERVPLAVNLKCDPDRAVELREMHDGAITPGWHMNKTHWNTCVLESLPVSLLIELTDHSYNLVVSKMTKKLQAELKAL